MLSLPHLLALPLLFLPFLPFSLYIASGASVIVRTHALSTQSVICVCVCVSVCVSLSLYIYIFLSSLCLLSLSLSINLSLNLSSISSTCFLLSWHLPSDPVLFCLSAALSVLSVSLSPTSHAVNNFISWRLHVSVSHPLHLRPCPSCAIMLAGDSLFVPSKIRFALLRCSSKKPSLCQWMFLSCYDVSCLIMLHISLHQADLTTTSLSISRYVFPSARPLSVPTCRQVFLFTLRGLRLALSLSLSLSLSLYLSLNLLFSLPLIPPFCLHPSLKSSQSHAFSYPLPPLSFPLSHV